MANESPQIPGSGENAQKLSHWQIYNSFSSLDTKPANEGSGQYAKIASGWESAVTYFAARIRQSSSSAWQGPAAESSRAAIDKYAKAGEDLTQPLKDLASRIDSAVDGVNRTRSTVHRPPDSGSKWNPLHWEVLGWHGPNSTTVVNDCQEAAQQAMQDHYVKNFVQADQQIPVLPVPDSPTDPLYTPAGGTPGLGNPNTSGTPSGPGTPSQPGDPSTTTDSPSTTTNNPSTTTGDPSKTTTGDPAKNTGDPSSTTTAGTPSTTTGQPTVPSGVTPQGTDPGGPGSPGGPGLTTGGPAGPGSSVPGGPAGAAPATGPGAVRAGGPGAAGMSGMGGMGAGRGKGEDDGEHQLPDYLRTMENTEELLGSAPVVSSDGVIGGE